MFAAVARHSLGAGTIPLKKARPPTVCVLHYSRRRSAEESECHWQQIKLFRQIAPGVWRPFDIFIPASCRWCLLLELDRWKLMQGGCRTGRRRWHDTWFLLGDCRGLWFWQPNLASCRTIFYFPSYAEGVSLLHLHIWSHFCAVVSENTLEH